MQVPHANTRCAHHTHAYSVSTFKHNTTLALRYRTFSPHECTAGAELVCLQAAGEHLAQAARLGRVRAPGGLPPVGTCLSGRRGWRARQHFREGPWGTPRQRFLSFLFFKTIFLNMHCDHFLLLWCVYVSNLCVVYGYVWCCEFVSIWLSIWVSNVYVCVCAGRAGGLQQSAAAGGGVC